MAATTREVAATTFETTNATLQELNEDPSQLVDHEIEDVEQTEAHIAECRASSEYSSAWSCAKAFDGDMNTEWATNNQGMCSWITLHFGKPVTINTMKYANSVAKARNKGVQLQFSDGSVESVQLRDDSNLNSFHFPEKTTSFVKIQVKSAFSSVNNGAREIEFWYINYQGCADAVVVRGADAHQTSRMGVYSKIGAPLAAEQAGRAIYRNADKNHYLYYWSPHGSWRIGADYASASAGVMSKSWENTHCPTQASSWFIYADLKWLPSSVTVTQREEPDRDASKPSHGHPDSGTR